MRSSNIPTAHAVPATQASSSSRATASVVVAASPAVPVFRAEAVHTASSGEIEGFHNQAGETQFQGGNASRAAAHFLRTGEMPDATILRTADSRVAGDPPGNPSGSGSGCCTIS